MDHVLTMILAGGAPDALGILGRHRAKTAVPFGGRFRLIDFPLSNCVNSGSRDIYILTQYNPRSLRRHIRLGRPWDLDRDRGGVHILLPYSGAKRTSWFKGTADALAQNLDILKRSRSRYVLVLSGDHIYKMDYRELFHRHVVTGATLTMATRPMKAGDGNRFGMIEADSAGFVKRLREKPGNDFGSDASLGIYLFDREFLIDNLERISEEGKYDLLHDLIIPAIATEKVATYRFDGYWEDVGSLDSYYRANLLLVDSQPSLQLDDPAWPIYTRMENVNPAWFSADSRVERSLVGAACRIEGEVRGSVLSPRVVVEKGASVENAVLLEGCRVAAGAKVHRAILDKMTVIGEGALFSGAEGLAILGKHSILPPGSRHLGQQETSIGELEAKK
ncbi:MAG: glucose-1-phosphate adenylyltransferase subunit GlgD [bacterium]|nr:glucose-1-phosphate adenylyltransferase subunit GlgD [bacterium]